MHISEADLILLLENKVSSETRRRLELHLADCERCSAELAAIRRMEKVLADTSAPKIEPSLLARAEKFATRGATHFFPMKGVARYAIAASIVLAVGIAGVLLLRQPLKISEFRSPAESPTAFTLQPEDGAVVSAVHFQWAKIPNALVYHASFLEEDGRILWTTSTPDTHLTIPSDIVLQPGKRYLWKVEAFLPDESKFGSRLHVFTYSP